MIHDRVFGVVLTAEIGVAQAATHSRSQEKAFEVKGVDHGKSWCLFNGCQGQRVSQSFSNFLPRPQS